MSGEGTDQELLRELEQELRVRLRALAVARGDAVDPEIEKLRAILDRFDTLMEGDSGPEVPEDLDRRVAASRLELVKLRSGEVTRRDAIGRIRLILLSTSGSTRDP